MSEDSQSGFNYYNAEWGGKFTSLDLACIIIYFFAVLADLSLAKWSRCRSKLTTLVAILCWLLVNVIAILFQAVSSRDFYIGPRPLDNRVTKLSSNQSAE